MAATFTRRQALLLGGAAALGGALTLGGTGVASGATPWVRLPVVTANIGRDNLGAREAAIRDVRNADGTRPLVGWQEIREGDDGEPAMITKHFGGAYQNAFLFHDTSFRVPISVPEPWNVIARNTSLAHGGIAGISPPRWLNELVLQHQSYPALTFAMLNTHYIFNAYNGDQNPNLRDEWDALKRLHRERVMAHYQTGRTVIWTADTNRPDYDKATGQDAERRAFTTGIDRIDWLPGNGVQVDLLNTKVVPMHVDGHDARVAIFNIRAV